jgi:hypothetical protein
MSGTVYTAARRAPGSCALIPLGHHTETPAPDRSPDHPPLPSRWARLLRVAIYLAGTVQLAGCYFTLVRPYVNTALYESGRERLPFQTRVLMMAPMWWAHRSGMAAAFAAYVAHSRFWYLRPPEPEAIVQLWINVASLLVAGWVAVQIHRAAAGKTGGPRGFLAFLVYPLFLVLFACHYILHTIQNFRFLYDLPGVAFFSVGLWMIYFRKSPWLFAALFLIATLNRETTLLLLPFYMLSAASRDEEFRWKNAFNLRTISVVIPLAAAWVAWHFFIFHIFKYNVSEYYPRLSLNLYTLVHPRYWPQLLSAGGYLLPFILLGRRSIRDPQLRAWLWVLPVWFGFMFFWGILVETRVFGELLAYLTCIAVLIAEDGIRAHLLNLPSFSSKTALVSIDMAEEEAA